MRNGMDIAFDEVMQSYYVIWKQVVIGTGKTRQKALKDLRRAAHFGADTFIDLTLENINKIKED